MLLFVAADPMEFAGLQKHCAGIAPLPSAGRPGRARPTSTVIRS